MARRKHPIFARFWRLIGPLADRYAGIGERRDELLAGLSGRVIEIGAGSGLNFARYPSTVTGVLAVEPEPALRRAAAEAARGATVPIEVVDGLAEDLPAEDASFDAGVACLVLCSVAEPARALAELHRVIKPGGEVRVFEHVRAEDPRHARLQRRADLVWPRLFAGCHTARDTPAALAAAGFEVLDLRRSVDGFGRLDPVSPHVIGRARRP